ncbi:MULTISPECIES: hypothetical protein [Chryseobacterium]|uniref:Uncharacterized protein n=1 Tax=Chryseobacterium camelliae TaxID=1265445 RepID=A0ABU0TI17_9FLAO|nr:MULTISPECIES: hypothetical protein [Chryseobacterium]MDT3409437.1 hypothetical protein [Pseudacidovorax intermedius]MDQ1096698.1 hypothetical protein [Chryseobacterium camelliae]MDQ1100642.1 hypothetical protein [Chryseobacterium sp. SORGH_AS_1048]MDR6087980.1 hypothetical protein [Chryseobacterium sp. SORGH_AS_0909]MDR6132355.1 hypothetical protein [Chryseobacterium sp. SORGH_AS_1175]
MYNCSGYSSLKVFGPVYESLTPLQHNAIMATEKSGNPPADQLKLSIEAM